MSRFAFLQLAVAVGVFTAFSAQARHEESELYFVRATAQDAAERTQIANAGIAIDSVFSDSVSFVGTQRDIDALKDLGVPYEITPMPERAFPTADSAFHDYAQTLDALDKIVQDHPDIATRVTVGKSLEGRELAGVRLSSAADGDSLPGIVFVGCHHAREHLSVEVPLLLAQYLADNYAKDARIKKILDTREIWVVPMLNPDGAEYDISGSRYKYWRKNRRKNSDGSYGIDLNRNYDAGFGGPGSSGDPSSDTYHGPSAFSEPETAALRDFLRDRDKVTMLLTFHTFSELVLWPYGHTNDQIANATDLAVFEKMGKKMATWNKYKPEKSSALYLASGDTTDWAYDELKMFAFTFELTPSSMLSGGFYPGAKAIAPTFKANLEPALYMAELADNPYRSLRSESDPLGILD